MTQSMGDGSRQAQASGGSAVNMLQDAGLRGMSGGTSAGSTGQTVGSVGQKLNKQK